MGKKTGLVSVDVIKTMTKTILGKKGFICEV